VQKTANCVTIDTKADQIAVLFHDEPKFLRVRQKRANGSSRVSARNTTLSLFVVIDILVDFKFDFPS